MIGQRPRLATMLTLVVVLGCASAETEDLVESACDAVKRAAQGSIAEWQVTSSARAGTTGALARASVAIAEDRPRDAANALEATANAICGDDSKGTYCRTGTPRRMRLTAARIRSACE